MYLETERLILRKPDIGDVQDYLDFANTEFVQQYNAMAAVTREAAEEEFANAKDDFGIAAIELKSSHKMIGLIYTGEDSLRYKVGSKEISYHLREEESRKGYMKEALRALIAYYFEVEQLNSITARSFVPNIASQRLLESLGFAREGVLRKCVKGYKDIIFDDCLYSLMREDWNS